MIFPQDMSTQSCWAAGFQQNSLALWRALALLSMMVPAVVAKRQEKPVLSTRMALSYIYNAGYKGGRHLSVEDVTEIKRLRCGVQKVQDIMLPSMQGVQGVCRECRRCAGSARVCREHRECCKHNYICKRNHKPCSVVSIVVVVSNEMF